MHALQRLVAVGMTVYAHAAFRLRVFGLENLRIEPGTVVTVSHRAEQDVPLLIGSVYRRFAATAGREGNWPVFAAREDLFLPGFLAGAPPKLPLVLRRALWPLTIGEALKRQLRCMPVREPTRMRLAELLRADSERALDEWLPDALGTALATRAARLGRPRPLRAGEALDGAYADILWQIVTRDTIPEADEQWRAHLRTAVADFRALVESVRSGEVLVIFPEGEPSESGEIGPLQGGLASLVRRAHPRKLQPVAIAYDPLAPGRTRAFVSVGPPLEPVTDGLEDTVRDALRLATPLTAGQLAASAVIAGATLDELERAAQQRIARAHADGRPVAPELLSIWCARVLERALVQARRLGQNNETVRRLARELESAHERSSPVGAAEALRE